MMKLIISLGFALIVLYSPAQSNGAKFFEQKINNTINFYVINTTAVPQDVNLNLVALKGLRGDKKPVTKRVEPKDTLQFYSFSISGAYSYNYNIRATPVFDLDTVSSEIDVAFDEGIVVFFKPDCPRSQRTVAYLVENDIEFKILNVTENKDYPVLMMQLLKEKRKSSKQLLYPIVLVNGEVHFNFDIPQSFQNIFKDF